MSDQALADRDWEAPGDDAVPLSGDAIDELAAGVDESVWTVVDNHHLEGSYDFPDFRTALEFTYDVGELAEDLWHHPDLHLSWGTVEIEIWTHELDGLYETDFIMAARIDRLYDEHGEAE